MQKLGFLIPNLKGFENKRKINLDIIFGYLFIHDP